IASMKLLFNIICFLFSILVSAQNAAELYETSISSSSSVFDEALNGIDMSSKDNNSTEPRAFLNYIFFDQEMNYVRAGFLQITTSAQGIGVHETISLNDIVADREGYILAYLSNENAEEVAIHWDDFTVYHGKTNIVYATNYYPHGATFSEFVRTASKPVKYRFQGHEWMSEVMSYDLGPRMWDPYTLRTNAPDILADQFPDQSPYSLFRGNPIKYTDPTGMAPVDWVEDRNGNIYWDDNATSQATTKARETYLGKNVLVATHNRDASGNEKVNTATFELYTKDGIVVPSTGPVATVEGNTVPSDTKKFGTLAEGIYPARFQARVSKPEENALIINEGEELPTVNGNPNNANSDNLTEIFFHRGNPYLESLRDSGGNPVWSHGCLTGGCGQGSLDRFNNFMENAQEFNGVLYLRSKLLPDFSIQSLMPKNE
ncbi:MAG: RHS repeat-associated core domain-containing protein, partial [Bacteroidota bacterium]